MPDVYSKRWPQYIPAGAVYVGRPTKWGNPYSHLNNTLAIYKTRTDKEAVAAYAKWIVKQPDLMIALCELRGMNLVCWCSTPMHPGPCHAHTLIKLANS